MLFSVPSDGNQGLENVIFRPRDGNHGLENAIFRP